MRIAERSDFFREKGLRVSQISCEIEYDNMVVEWEVFKTSWEDALNSSSAVRDMFKETLEVEVLGDCNGCGKDHDPWECPNIR